MDNWFDIQYTRRHVNRKPAVADRARVLAKTPAAAIRFLLNSLRRNSRAGVYQVVAVAPANGGCDVAAVAAAKKALRRAGLAKSRIAILKAIVRGAKKGAPAAVKAPVEVAVEPAVVIPASVLPVGVLSM